MVLNEMGKALNNAMKKAFRRTFIDDVTIKELLKDIQRSLLVSDVSVELVMKISKDIEHRLLESEMPKGISKKDYVIRVLWETLTVYLGEKEESLKFDLGKPNLIMFVGIQGSGKTTTVGKLAKYYQTKGIKTGVICADNFRPGAYDQLKQLIEHSNIPFYGNKNEKDAIKLSNDGYNYMKSLNIELILLDTSGRHSKEDSLIVEMKGIIKKVKPKEVILVIDGTLGQQAKKQAKAFKDATDIGSIIITKLDGSSKGGGALSAVAETGASIKFIGVGESINALKGFNPKDFVGSLLGIPDLEGLLKKIKNTETSIDRDKRKRLLKGDFTLIDMMEQIKEVEKIGSLEKLTGMLGFKYKVSDDDIRIGKEKMKQWEIIMESMTQTELINPKIIKQSRRKRIAMGSGTDLNNVRELLEHYNQTKSMMKRMRKQR